MTDEQKVKVIRIIVNNYYEGDISHDNAGCYISLIYDILNDDPEKEEK